MKMTAKATAEFFTVDRRTDGYGRHRVDLQDGRYCMLRPGAKLALWYDGRNENKSAPDLVFTIQKGGLVSIESGRGFDGETGEFRDMVDDPGAA